MSLSLKAARVNAGHTQRTAADALNISKSSIQNYENYRIVPDVDLAKRMAKLYGLSVDDIKWTK